MMYRTCIGCRFETAPCMERARVKRQLAGLAVTSIKWRCRYRTPTFQPGDAVFAELPFSWEFDDTDFGIFPGIVISAKRPHKPVVFVAPGTLGRWAGEPQDDRDPVFKPRDEGGRGFCKVGRHRLTRRNAVREYICPSCENPTRLLGHADHCQHVFFASTARSPAEDAA